MAKECFVERRFNKNWRGLIENANDIIAEFTAQGFTLTVRQLYYQMVARDMIENVVLEYKRVVEMTSAARLAGAIDWDAIEDRTRNLQRLASWLSPAGVIDSAAHGYREDLWIGQTARVEVWIEKDALLGVIEGVCDEMRVPYFSFRGSNSQSEQYKAGCRFLRYINRGLTPIVLHLSDHDPKGIDMVRDNQKRLSMFAGRPIEVRRLALNMPQVEHYNPPPNPAKETDSLYGAYVAEYGAKCWELDALSPPVIAGLIRGEITGIIDADAWNTAKAEEDASRERLATLSERWDEVETFLDEM